MNKDIETTIKALKKNNFDVIYAEKAEDVPDIILKLIPEDATIEMAGSMSVNQTGIMKKLRERGNKGPRFPSQEPLKALHLNPRKERMYSWSAPMR